jgi:hypothetical protein
MFRNSNIKSVTNGIAPTRANSLMLWPDDRFHAQVKVLSLSKAEAGSTKDQRETR